jgi:hypothetical protein
MTPTIFLPRGIRNNNPGNIRIGASRWEGQRPVQADPDFVEFDDPVSGLRALMRVLMTYRLKYGLDTVESLINRFAPPKENATDNYIYIVSRALGVKRKDAIDVLSKPVLAALAAAIARQENGAPPKDRPPGWYSGDTYDRAAALALLKP